MSCRNNNVDAKFIEIKDNVARFDIINNSDVAIEKITFEIRYLDVADAVLKIDTINYRMCAKQNKERTPFLRANEKTFIAQVTPEKCDKAVINILKTFVE